jgi:capsid portal protein
MAEPVKVTAEILRAPEVGEGRTQQLNLGEWAYDEHKCATPIVDPTVLARMYSRNVPHKACVDAKTVNCVGLGWLFKPKEGADPEQAKETGTLLEDFLNLCARRDQKTWSELLTSIRKDEESVGWAAMEITRNGRGQVDGTFHVHAYTLRRRIDRDGWVQKVNGKYVYFRDYGRAVEDTKDPVRFALSNEIIVIGEDAPDSPFYPLPDHVPALGDMLGDEAAQDYQVGFFQQNCVPRLAICVEGGTLDPETKAYVLTYLRDGIKGQGHQTLLLQTASGEAKIKIEKLTVDSHTDADFMAYRKWCRDMVIMSHRVSPMQVSIVENANLANSVGQSKAFKDQVMRPDQDRYEARIQWLLEDEFGRDLPLLFKFVEMDLEDEEQIARTRSYYMPAMSNNDVRELYGLGKAGIDPDIGAVTDPALEEWGRAPFEQSVTPASFGHQAPGSQPLFKSLAPQHREFAGLAAGLGYIIDRIDEVIEKSASDPYADPALPKEHAAITAS